MRLLVVNPNTTDAATEVMRRAAEGVAREGETVRGVSAPFGAPYISSRAESAIAAHAVLQALAAEAGRTDAAVVAAYTDSGLVAARELFPFPVVGIAEASMLTACAVGGRFGIVGPIARLLPVYLETVRAYGLESRCAGVRAEDIDVGTLDGVTLPSGLVRAAEACRDEDGADVVLLGGGPMAGLAPALSREIGLPVLDGVQCAVGLARSLLAMGVERPRHGGYRPPDPKTLSGIDPALASRFRRE